VDLASERAAELEAAARAAQQRIVDSCRHPAGDFEPVVLATPEELPAYLERQAAACAACLALRKGDERLTYGELEARAADLARRILALTGPDPAPVAVCADSGPTAVVAMLAVHRLRRTWSREVDAYLVYSPWAAALRPPRDPGWGTLPGEPDGRADSRPFPDGVVRRRTA
jgi:non-ribosomal peptide synthetase component F